ncbi:hypothetical protein PIIN_09505 [Serendipita indica DSM 11827]|uniref:F-box domain-containing protein n=1 Tax=Serendipita indica (strain DSM 11827) TaxID=1109443 RepID=G4TW29_SERID|nr:hypothetical protein PIIN_09505 [Serendipita indica DSM 11827]
MPGLSAFERVPVEVLSYIFLIVRDEPAYDPVALPNLELVCRSWAVTLALYPSFWCHLSISIGWRPIGFWLSYTKAHLRRARSDQLLVIKFATSPIRRWWLEEGGFEIYQKLVQTLTGEHGEVAQRWKRLQCELFGGFESVVQDTLFIFPTPNLEWLELEEFVSPRAFTMLPSTPSLRHLRLTNCIHPIPQGISLGDIKSLKSLDTKSKRVPPLLPLLPRATTLSTLKLWSLLEWQFVPRTTLPALRELCLAGPILPDAFRHFDAPNLEVLRFRTDEDVATPIFNCLTFPFQNICHLDLTCRWRNKLGQKSPEPRRKHFQSVKLLKAFTNISTMEIHNYDETCELCSTLVTQANLQTDAAVQLICHSKMEYRSIRVAPLMYRIFQS